MGNSYSKAKGRKETGNFFMYPKSVLECENYKNLSHIGRSLLLDTAIQFTGKNNGDLTACHSHLVKRGWKSKTTIKKHIDELLHYGFLICVQRGGINCGSKQRPNLYAFTWLRIDKVAYSDGFSSNNEWKVGQISGAWKEVKQSFKPIKPRRQPPIKKSQGHLMYLTSTTSCT
jgi:hypothetical protein